MAKRSSQGGVGQGPARFRNYEVTPSQPDPESRPGSSTGLGRGFDPPYPVFVPSAAFPEAKLWGQGPAEPSVTDVGPTSIPVFGGPAYGDVRRQDGARLMDDEKPKMKGKLPSADAHLPENA